MSKQSCCLATTPKIFISKSCWRLRPISSLKDINENCLDQFRKHWECLEQNNQQLWHCRPAERSLNACVFEKLVCLCLCSNNSFPSKSHGLPNVSRSYVCRFRVTEKEETSECCSEGLLARLFWLSNPFHMNRILRKLSQAHLRTKPQCIYENDRFTRSTDCVMD